MNAVNADLKFREYTKKIAFSNNISDVGQIFTVEPGIQKKVEEKIQESSEFLSKINAFGITGLKASTVKIGIANGVTKRTNTDKDERTASAGTTEEEIPVELVEFEHDIKVSWKKIAQWAGSPEFEDIYRSYYEKKIANDRLYVCWNGEEASTETTSDLKKIDKGIPAKLKEINPTHYIDPESVGLGKIVIGEFPELDFKGAWQTGTKYIPGDVILKTIGSGDDEKDVYFYCKKLHTSDTTKAPEPTMEALTNNWTCEPQHNNLDEAVADAIQIIPDHLQTDLVVMIGSDLVQKTKSKVYSEYGGRPTEKQDIKYTLDTFGGLQAVVVPFMPAGSFCITSFDNLSWYYEKNHHKRSIKDEEKAKAKVDYNLIYGTFCFEEASKIVFVTGLDFLTVNKSLNDLYKKQAAAEQAAG